MKREAVLELPWPPSGNHQHGRSKRGKTFLTDRAKSYRCDVGWLAKRIDTFGTRKVGLEIHVFPPDRRARDLDNLVKSASDALMHAGIFKDDSQIDDLHVIRGEVRKGDRACLLVRIREL